MVAKTHITVKEPEISVRYLADYMGASERAKRAIISDCKFRPIARLIQLQEARRILATFLLNGKTNCTELKEKAESIRNRFAESDFDVATNESNACYLERASQMLGILKLPLASLSLAMKFSPQTINGVKVIFSPHLLLDRIAKKNKKQRGALMFRYLKATPLKPEVGAYQSAAIFGLLREISDKDSEEVERALCVTVDAFDRTVYPANGKAVSAFLNMKAALASIAERWPAIKPPQNSIL